MVEAAGIEPALGHDPDPPSCSEAASPACDGFCTTPGEACIDFAESCGCFPSRGAGCGVLGGPPLCGGECPPFEGWLTRAPAFQG